MDADDEAQRFLEAFGETVRARREERGLTQEELGFRSELDRTYLSGIERGRRNPTLRSIWTIASALDCGPDTLVKAAMKRLAAEE